jgi:hypothetical protein
MQDADLRDDVRQAYENLRSAYSRASNGWGPTAKALLEDKKLQKDLRRASDNLQSAGAALRDTRRKPKKRRLGRLVVLALVGTAVALGVSEGLRNKLLDALFGAEEEFDYTSTTTPPPAPAASSEPAGTASSG